jgi:hypothetical protein
MRILGIEVLEHVTKFKYPRKIVAQEIEITFLIKLRK